MIVFTSKWKAKELKILETAKVTTLNQLPGIANRVIKKRVVKNAPDKFQEEEIVSVGRYRGQLLGKVGDRGRFFKKGRDVFMRTAIKRERPIVVEAKNTVRLKMGNTVFLNSNTGFSWRKNPPKGKGHSTIRSTKIDNFAQILENGGVWHVTARDAGDLLSPQNKEVVPEMTKGIGVTFSNPFRMYSKGLRDSRKGVIRTLRKFLKEALARI